MRTASGSLDPWVWPITTLSSVAIGCSSCSCGRSAAVVELEAGAQQVDRLDPISDLQVRLLLDDVEAVVAAWDGPEAESPRDVHASADLANGAVEDLEVLGTAEPTFELGGDLVRALA